MRAARRAARQPPPGGDLPRRRAGDPGRRAASSELSIVDVAPLLLYSLGVPVPDDMSGRVPAEVFEPGELERRPPRFAAAAAPDAPRPPADDARAATPRSRQTIMSRLRALGYVE